MENKLSLIPQKYNYPQKSSKLFSYSFLKKTKRNKSSKTIKKSTKSLFHINLFSKFIYDFDSYIIIYQGLKNKNSIKLNLKEKTFLKNKIDEILLLKSEIFSREIISISIDTLNKINTFLPLENSQDEATKYISDLLKSQTNRESISCRKIASKYFSDTGKTISKNKVNLILRNKLNYRFLKTSIKNVKINDDNNMIFSFCFIKLIIKCMKLNFKLIFVDESSVQSYNSNYRTWRLKDEDIYYKIDNKKRNLIAAVGESEIIYYEINEQNTNESVFLQFMKNLKIKLEQMNINQFVIILDNLSCHKTPLLKSFYEEEKMNIIFNSPYHSNFNCIELLFRIMKKKLYEKLYKSTEDAINEINIIMNDKNINKTLIQNFRETLENYYRFSVSHESTDLNTLKCD